MWDNQTCLLISLVIVIHTEGEREAGGIGATIFYINREINLVIVMVWARDGRVVVVL